jgi:hypothetical protein
MTGDQDRHSTTVAGWSRTDVYHATHIAWDTSTNKAVLCSLLPTVALGGGLACAFRHMHKHNIVCKNQAALHVPDSLGTGWHIGTEQ